MSGLLAGKVWLSGLSSKLKPLAATLADIANDDGSRIFPGVPYVTWRLGWSERSTRAGLKALRRLGVLETAIEGGHGPGSLTEYRLVEANLPQRPPWKKGANPAPFLFDMGAKRDSRRVQNATSKGAKSSINSECIYIDPSLEPLKEHPSKPAAKAAPSAPLDPRPHAVYEFSRTAYRATHGDFPTWDGSHRKNLSTFLRRNPDVSYEEWIRRFKFYLASTDKFIVDQGGSLRFFVSRFDAFSRGPIHKTAQGGSGHATTSEKFDDLARYAAN
jgi:hypothetical protein